MNESKPAITPLILDGVTYNSDMVDELRQSVIELRDEALKQGDFFYGISLSHVIAVLSHYKTLLKDN